MRKAANPGRAWPVPIGLARCAYAIRDQNVLAVAVATPRFTHDGLRDVRLNYVVDAGALGRGYATLLSCLAMQATEFANEERANYVSAQILDSNEAAAHVAHKLGLRRDKELDFSCVFAGKTLSFSGLTMPADAFRAEAERRISKRTGAKLARP